MDPSSSARRRLHVHADFDRSTLGSARGSRAGSGDPPERTLVILGLVGQFHRDPLMMHQFREAV